MVAAAAVADGEEEEGDDDDESGEVASIHITQLVRPFTKGRLEAWLSEHGKVEMVWLNRVKSHAYVTFATPAEAAACRAAIHGEKWPPISGKILDGTFFFFFSFCCCCCWV